LIAYKFLSAGATGPFTGFRWPVPAVARPGAWVEAADGRSDHGVHACRLDDLAFWQDVELWRAELAEPVVEGQRQVISARGRLLDRVSAWNEELARSFGEACAWRARDRSVEALRIPGCHEESELLARCRSLSELHIASKELSSRKGLPAALAGYVAEAIDFLLAGDSPCSTYISARAAVVASGGNESEFAAERQCQARWLAERLGLEPTGAPEAGHPRP
jgi:hypothetical protein